jgi:hypothetical protein
MKCDIIQFNEALISFIRGDNKPVVLL